MSPNKQTYQYGMQSESDAIAMLCDNDYQIIAQRYKTKAGEIDIIALQDQTLVFIEVKARKKNELLETVLRHPQIMRIKKAAELFLALNPIYQQCDIRFDFILFGEDKNPEHHKNFF